MPEIKLSDLLETATFQLAYALAAVLSSIQHDWITASIEFTKSVLFGTRILIIIEESKFPISYNEIVKESKTLHLDKEYQKLIAHALEVRAGTKPEERMLYANITFLNQIVVRHVKEKLEHGDSVILEGQKT